jgi:hypothetical protein
VPDTVALAGVERLLSVVLDSLERPGVEGRPKAVQAVPTVLDFDMGEMVGVGDRLQAALLIVAAKVAVGNIDMACDQVAWTGLESHL